MNFSSFKSIFQLFFYSKIYSQFQRHNAREQLVQVCNIELNNLFCAALDTAELLAEEY